MMPYYVVNRVGAGTVADPYRPDVDAGSSYVGQVGRDGKYLITTPITQSAKAGRIQLPPIQQLKDACAAKGINFDDVMNKWSLR